LTKVGDEKVWNESTNNGVFEVFPIGVDELFSRNVFSMSKVGSPSRLVFDVHKSTDEFDVDLDHAKFAFLVG
jgi:hypothetical protein